MEEGELGHLDQLQDHVELFEAQVCGNGDSMCVVCVCASVTLSHDYH